MNGKQAKKLRKLAKLVKGEGVTEYQDFKDSLWGKLPMILNAQNKPTNVIDKKKLKKAIIKSRNPKFRGQGHSIEFRYIVGQPRWMATGWRQLYQDAKKEYLSDVR